jgi:hypothetical protein
MWPTPTLPRQPTEIPDGPKISAKDRGGRQIRLLVDGNPLQFLLLNKEFDMSGMARGQMLLLAVATGLTLARSCPASTIYIDFGRTGAETSATGWNNVTATVGGTANNTTVINAQGTPGTPSVELIDSTGAASGVTLSVAFTQTYDTGAAGSGADYAGPYPAKVSTWPAAAVSDGFFSQINNGGSTMNMSFSGLDDSLTYDLMFYGARGTGSGLNQAKYTVTGAAGATERTSSVLNNDTQTPEFLGVAPVSGVITVAFTRGSSGTGSLNAMSVTAVPEPSLAAGILAAVASVGLFFRQKIRNCGRN